MENTTHNPEIICPFIRAAVKEGKLDLDSEQRVKTSQLRGVVRHLSMSTFMTYVTAGVAMLLANRIRDIPSNLVHRKFNPFTMHLGSIKHKYTTEILTKQAFGHFDEECFEYLVSFSKDGSKITEDNLNEYNEQRGIDEKSMGAKLNRLEFNLLLDFLGEVNDKGLRYISIDNLRDLYQHALLPKHKVPSIKGEVFRKESDRPLAGIQVELRQDSGFSSSLLQTVTTDADGAFCIVPPHSKSYMTLKFIDPRPSMGRDKRFYELGLGRVKQDLDLGRIDAPHWLYDQDVPFPVARINEFTNKIPQRFTRAMSWRFYPTAFFQSIKKFIIQKFFFSISLSRLHAVFPGDKRQRNLQDEDSDAYFMYRVLNGFNPSTIYKNDQSDSKFPDAMYFIDCNLDGSKSDGRHNLISAQLYFDIKDYDSEPTPIGIHLRIRAVNDTKPWSTPETEKSVACSDSVEWRIAKQAFRSAWATAGEIDAHLGTGHLNVGQYAIAAYRNFFASPLRQLLLPVLRGVTEINELGSDSIFGKDGVLSTCSPLSSDALLARLGSHLGTLDWYNWRPPQPMYAGHNYPLAANLYWNIVDELVNEYFDKHQAEIEEHASEVLYFSIDLVRNCLPLFTANTFTVANQPEVDPAKPELPKLRSVGFKPAQQKYQKHEGLGAYSEDQQLKNEEDHPLSVNKIENLEDIKHCSKYIIFHATFWHWWSNDLQATDLSNIFYASLGLRNGAHHLNTESLPPAFEAADQLTFANLLTSIRVGLIMKGDQGEVIGLLARKLRASAEEFKKLQTPFELKSTFDVKNIRSRINI